MSYHHFVQNIESERILEALGAQQHLWPGQPLAEALPAVSRRLGLCPQTTADAIRAFGVAPDRSIGRLRRVELARLAQAIACFCRQRPATTSRPVAPASAASAQLPCPPLVADQTGLSPQPQAQARHTICTSC